MQPTYYVKHPDGSFSEVPAASGQPDIGRDAALVAEVVADGGGKRFCMLMDWDQLPVGARVFLAAQAAPEVAGGTDVVPQWRKRGTCQWHDGHADNEDGGGPYENRTLYTRPQPAPAAPNPQVAVDAARWRELMRQHKSENENTCVVMFDDGGSMDHVDDPESVIDAARANKEKQS